MDILIQSGILILGLLFILFGANWLVDGASDVAKRFGLSEFVIGLTIVGIGTSSPEMVTSFMAAIQGTPDIAIGNVIGSNIFNAFMIIGVTALIAPIGITKSNLFRDIPTNLGVTILLIILALKYTIFGIGTANQIGRIDGIIMLCLFAWYIYSSFKRDRTSADDESSQEAVKPRRSIFISAVMIISGLVLLILGGKFFVSSATKLAVIFSVPQKFIAITIMAAGTSLPELATCAVAAYKGQGQLALGNVLGSNISNILLILGGSAIISPLSFSGISAMDLTILLMSACAFILTAWTVKRMRIDRSEGVILICIQIFYMVWLICHL